MLLRLIFRLNFTEDDFNRFNSNTICKHQQRNMAHEQLIDKLKKLGGLHASGIITDEEFQEMKQMLLKRENETDNVGPESVSELEDSVTTLYDNQREREEATNISESSRKERESIVEPGTSKLGTKNNIESKTTKRDKLFFGIIAIVLCGLVLLFVFRKSEYEKAVDSIEQQQGYILADINESESQILVYSTDKGLYLWNLKNKEPLKLYTEIDSLKVIGYYLDDNYNLRKYESEYPKEIDDYSGEVVRTRPNVIQSVNPLKLYKVEWPWILIGKHYIAHISNPNQLINISGDDTGDIFDGLPDIYDRESRGDGAPSSVNIDYHGNLIFEIGEWAFNLPGMKEYDPIYIDKQTWDNRKYIDPQLVEAYGKLFQSEYEMENALGISLPNDNFVYRKVIINTNNKIASQNQLIWGEENFNDSILSTNGMQSIYKSLEIKYKNIIQEALPQKRAELEKYASEYKERMIARIKQEAIDVDVIINAYKNNTRRAIELYPRNHRYTLKVGVDKIRYLNYSQTNYMYQLVRDEGFTVVYYLSNDNQFRNQDYPNTFYISAILNDYNLDHNFMGSSVTDAKFLFLDAELLLVN